jgi:hypothetical protein
MAELIYRGNPGYQFPFTDGPVNPGDTVDVPDALVDSVGGDFEAKSKTSKPKPTETLED